METTTHEIKLVKAEIRWFPAKFATHCSYSRCRKPIAVGETMGLVIQKNEAGGQIKNYLCPCCAEILSLLGPRPGVRFLTAVDKVAWEAAVAAETALIKAKYATK